MRTNLFAFAATLAAMFMPFTASINPAYAQEAASTNLKLVPSQERIPQPDGQPRLPPELFVPPIGSPPSSIVERKNPPPTATATAAASATAAPVSRNHQQFKAPLITGLESGKWYVQIGAYTRADYVEAAVNRVGTASPMVIHNAGTESNPMFRVMLGPFSQSESKTMLQRFKDKGYDAFLRSGN